VWTKQPLAPIRYFDMHANAVETLISK